MGRYSGKSCRIVSMLLLTVGFLLVELVVGHLSKSLALIADAFHMLSDTMALAIGLIAVKLAKRQTSNTNTYGWARAEIVGALINAVFLVALSFTIFVEAVERLAMRESIEDAQLLLYVGGVGLAINLIGLALFHDQAHGHTHGGIPHTHSHGHSHSDDISHESIFPPGQEEKLCGEIPSSEGDNDAEDMTESSLVTGTISTEDSEEERSVSQTRAQQLNMRGVFIHVLGDALGSVVVMISAGITLLARRYLSTCTLDTHHHHKIIVSNLTNVVSLDEIECIYKEPEWVLCIDPILSLLLVAIILSTSIPLLKQAGLVLMQTVPSHIELEAMKNHIEKMRGLEGIHDFHVWSLAGNKVIASLHIHTKCLEDYLSLAQTIKIYLHNKGIHSVTIQPEFPHIQERKDGRVCCLECGPDLDCYKDTCCGKNADLRHQCLANSINIV